MAKSFRNFVKRSIFLRLLIIFLFTAVILFSLVGGVASYLSDPDRFIHQQFQNNIARYAAYLIEEMGAPPEQKTAQSLSDSLGLGIKISDQNGSWQTRDFSLPAAALKKAHQIKSSADMKMGHYRGYSYVTVKKTEQEITFVMSHRRFAESKGIFLVALIIIVFIVIAICYHLVRWLFRPMDALAEGVKQVSDGNFDFRVATKRQDELGQLAAGFNQMSEKIQSMMTEKEQLLLDVSHELRSPITRIKLALELQDDKTSTAGMRDDLREMESMITELLESARLNNPNSNLVKSNIVLNALIDSVVENYADTRPGILFNAEGKETHLLADADRLQICIRNMIENAMKYSQHQAKPVEIHLREHEDSVQIDIVDFGVGVPIADQKHIFEPFYRVDKSRNTKTGGYGLGLSLCKKIVTAHGGDIQLQSIENQKTCFSLIFPKA